MNNRVLPQSF